LKARNGAIKILYGKFVLFLATCTCCPERSMFALCTKWTRNWIARSSKGAYNNFCVSSEINRVWNMIVGKRLDGMGGYCRGK
jgi:hypothetical protein